MRLGFLFLAAAFVASLLTSCAGYSVKVAGPRAALERGEYDKAIADLEKLAAKQDNDELLFLLDLGIAYHASGRYKEAIDAFNRADKVAALHDYVSITAEVGSTLLNDDAKKYRGEDFEKLLIPMYRALDYALLQQWDEALVECRQVNHYIDILVAKGQKTKKHNGFAKYLAGALFEADGDTNAALVDYRQLLKWGYGDFPYLGPSLVRLTRKLSMEQELEEFKKKWPKAPVKLPPGYGEVIVLVEQGKAPLKVPDPNARLIPIFRRNQYVGNYAVLKRDGGTETAKSETLYDIEETAIKELDEARAGIIAKKAAGVVAKEAAALAVEKASDNKTLGALTSIFLHVTDKADTRSWTTLPARLQLIRVAVPSGEQNFTLDLQTEGGGSQPGVRRFPKVAVKANKITFLHARLPQ